MIKRHRFEPETEDSGKSTEIMMMMHMYWKDRMDKVFA